MVFSGKMKKRDELTLLYFFSLLHFCPPAKNKSVRPLLKNFHFIN